MFPLMGSEVLGAEAECASMKCDQISNTFTVVAICTFASNFWGTPDSKWDEVGHICGCVLASSSAPLGPRAQRDGA